MAYLLNWLDWSPAVAETMAAEDGLELRPEHWQVHEILREYYGDYEIAPPMRALIRILKQRTGDDRFASRQLYRLFPAGAGQTGLPLRRTAAPGELYLSPAWARSRRGSAV